MEELKTRYSKIGSTNEPADSPVTAAYVACGFREVDRQHEMARTLEDTALRRGA